MSFSWKEAPARSGNLFSQQAGYMCFICLLYQPRTASAIFSPARWPKVNASPVPDPSIRTSPWKPPVTNRKDAESPRSPSLRAFWRSRKSPKIDKARRTLPRCACSPPHASAHTAPCSDREFPDMSAKRDGISCSCSVTHRYCTFRGILLHSRYHSIPLHYDRFHTSDKCNVFHWQIRPVP